MMLRALAAGLSLAAISAPAVAATAGKPSEQDWRTPAPETIMVIDTSKGRVLVELVPEAAPHHVARLQDLTRARIYDGRTFFRVIDRFMAQTGDPTNTGEGGSDRPNLKAEFTFRRAVDTAFVPMAAPAGLEVGYVKSLPVVSQAWSWADMTADHKVAAWGTYCPGVIGMARDEDNNSANSQFFLMRQPYPSLDKRYTAFGRVISGLDAVRAIKTGEPVPAPQDQMQRVRLLSDLPETQRPQVRVIDPKGPWFAGETKRLRALKGADFSVCDIDLPVEVR